RIKGATLGNDVNLRDFEGRSALLLGKAKDNNASCAIGPFIRLFDDGFTLDDVRRAEIVLDVHGAEDFHLQGRSSMAKISRDPTDLVEQATGSNHQYPDGFMLFLGTMFAPVDDRGAPGMGFTHQPDDRVVISATRLGALENRGPTRRRPTPRSPPRAPHFPHGRCPQCRIARICSTPSATRYSPARTSSGDCFRAKKARPCPRASVKSCARDRSSSSSAARRCGWPEKRSSRSVRASRSKSRASRWGSSASL